MRFNYVVVTDDGLISHYEQRDVQIINPKYIPRIEGQDYSNKKYNFETNNWEDYVYPVVETDPTLEDLATQIQLNTEYLVCLAEINNM